MLPVSPTSGTDMRPVDEPPPVQPKGAQRQPRHVRGARTMIALAYAMFGWALIFGAFKLLGSPRWPWLWPCLYVLYVVYLVSPFALPKILKAVAARRLARVSSTGWISPWPLWALRVHMAYRFDRAPSVEVAVTLPVRINGASAQWRAGAAWKCPAGQEAPRGNYRDSGRSRSARDASRPYQRFPDLEALARGRVGEGADLAVLVNGEWSLVLVVGATRMGVAERQLLAATAMNAWNQWSTLGSAGGTEPPRCPADTVRAIAIVFLSKSSPVVSRLSLARLRSADWPAHVGAMRYP